MRATPDGSRVYVGGAFTQVDGTTLPGGLTTLDGATGALVGPTFQNITQPVDALDLSADGRHVAAAQTGTGNQGDWYNVATGVREMYQRCGGDAQAITSDRRLAAHRLPRGVRR